MARPQTWRYGATGGPRTFRDRLGAPESLPENLRRRTISPGYGMGEPISDRPGMSLI